MFLHRFFFLTSYLFLSSIPIFSRDLIIDRDGNEIDAIVITADQNGNVVYKLANDSMAVQKVLARSKVFMIKYEDGRKDVVKNVTKAQEVNPVSQGKVAVSLLGGTGVFGLFNVNNIFTKSSYTLSLNPSIDIKIAKYVWVGAEALVLWGKPETKDDLRLIIDPSVRIKTSFPLNPRITIEPMIAGGFSFWPKAEGEPYIDSTLLDSRSGWNMRAAVEVDFAVTSKISLMVEAGYSASSSQSKATWITHDMMLVGVGPRIRF